MSTESRTRAWIEVRGAALRRNLGRIRRAVGPEPRLIPMVKADAYGLDVGPAVSALAPTNPWGWGVATIQEGLELRGLGETRPILVVAPTLPGAVSDALRGDLTLGISDLALLERVQAEAGRQNRKARVHLEIDTGIGRAGLDWRTVREWGSRAAEILNDKVSLEGLFTHLHSADMDDEDSVERQAQRFRDAVAALPEGLRGAMLHLCNSAGALRTPHLAADGVRPGIFLYGGRAGVGLPAPEEVVTVRARIALAREVAPGTTVGYGATYRAQRWERWATLTIGYGDGLPRALSNRGHVLVRGRRAPIIGRISMDTTVVDITDIPGIVPGDFVTLVGTDGEERISLEEVADHAETINYEILTGFTPRIPRLWIDEGSEGGSPK